MILDWDFNLLNTSVYVASINPQGSFSTSSPVKQPEYPVQM